MLRDELAKVAGIIERHERMIQELGEQLVRLTLERDRAVLEIKQVRLKMDILRAENEELRARLAKYVYTIEAYDNQHISPSRKTITQKDINAQKERKKKNLTGRHGPHKGHKGVSASRNADYTMRHTPDRCGSCGGANLKTVKMVPMI